MVDPAIEHWAVPAEQLARCLVATIPAYMDSGYGDVAARFIDGQPPIVDEGRKDGTWLRTGLGYAFIGPPGGAHFYTRRRPDGVPDSEIVDMQAEPPGRLYAALRRAAEQARRLASGETAQAVLNGQAAPAACTEADRQAIAQLGEVLEGSLAAASPGYNATILRDHAGQMLGAMGEGRTAAEALQLSYKAVDDRRGRHAADGWLVAVTLTRALLADFLPSDAAGRAQLLAKSMESLSSGHDPERLLHRIVLDYASAGHADRVIQAVDFTIARAREAREAALSASSVTGHLEGLSQAAGMGFTAWLLADLMRRAIPPQYWPEHMTAAKLSGYVATAEETVVRGSVALEVGCVNTATRAALDAHVAEVKLRGADWADELIEQYWYYPRAARELLLDHGPA